MAIASLDSGSDGVGNRDDAIHAHPPRRTSGGPAASSAAATPSVDGISGLIQRDLPHQQPPTFDRRLDPAPHDGRGSRTARRATRRVRRCTNDRRAGAGAALRLRHGGQKFSAHRSPARARFPGDGGFSNG